MKLEAVSAEHLGWGVYQIFFDSETDRVYIDNGIAMYYSGASYHSMNDTCFSFTAQLVQDQDIYISLRQSETGEYPHSNTKVYKSIDGGKTWNLVETDSLPAESLLLSSVSL